MKAVLDALTSLHGKPIEKLSPAQARKQPGPPQAVAALLKKQGKPTDPEAVGSVKDSTVPGPAGPVPVRVYTPADSGTAAPLPVIVYFHGGGWVIAGVQGYDASARALCNAAKAMVVSVGYRQAPEHAFPAAHEDSYAVTQYVLKNAAQMGGDPKKVAVLGESAGGNLASAVCLMARDRKGLMPIYEVLVYPVTDTRTNFASVRENYTAKPLNGPMLSWFYKYTTGNVPAKLNSRYLSILRNPNLRGLPPTTVILAQIDPLRTEGELYAKRLKAAGVPVKLTLYKGVTHEFFGMAAVLDKAKQANQEAAQDLDKAFGQ